MSSLTKSQRKHAARSRRRAKARQSLGIEAPKAVDTSIEAQIPELKLEPTQESLKLDTQSVKKAEEARTVPKAQRIPAADSERRLALTMALHPRLGKMSLMQRLNVPKPLLREILAFGANQPTCFMVGGCAIGRVGSQIDAENARANVYFLREREGWQEACPLTVPRGRVATAVVRVPGGERQILAAGGQSSTHANPELYPPPLTSCELYSSVRNAWTPLQCDLPEARVGAVAVQLSGKAYLLGGHSTAKWPYKNVYSILALETDDRGMFWRKVGQIPNDRTLEGITATSFGSDEILVTTRFAKACKECLGGEGNRRQTMDCKCARLQVEVFNVSNGKWRSLPSLSPCVDSPAVGTLLDPETKQPAMIVIAGGIAMDEHFWMDGCPTGNRAVPEVHVLRLPREAKEKQEEEPKPSSDRKESKQGKESKESKDGKESKLAWEAAPCLSVPRAAPGFVTFGRHLLIFGGLQGSLYPGMTHQRTSEAIDMAQLLELSPPELAKAAKQGEQQPHNPGLSLPDLEWSAAFPGVVLL